MPVVPNPQEVCRVEIDNLSYSTWESVVVALRWLEGFDTFDIAVSEPTPSPISFAATRFNVGDSVKVYLAGQLAISGLITTRQSASDAERHGVQLIGKSENWQMTKSSVPLKQSNFDGMTLPQVAAIVAGAYGVAVKIRGVVDPLPFAQLQAIPGEPAWDFLEKVARARETILGSDETGALVLAGQDAPTVMPDVFQEGGANRNIERISVVINNDTLFKNYFVVGQNAGHDQQWGGDVAQMLASVPGNDAAASAIVVPNEEAGNMASIQRRLMFEAQIREGTLLTATVVTPTWLRSNGALFKPGDVYTLMAPDHLPDTAANGIQLAARAVTFEQNEASGTTTTLELVLPAMLNGGLYRTGLPAAPIASDVTLEQGSNNQEPQPHVDIGVPQVTGQH